MQRHLLQSPQWAEFQIAQGKTVINHHIADGDFIALVEKSHGKVGKFISRLYVPYGPTCTTEEELVKSIEQIELYAKQQKVDYVRIEPIGAVFDAKILSKLGYRKRSQSTQPEQTNIIAFKGKNQDEILSAMNATNRNLWRKNSSTKDGVTFTDSFSSKDAGPLTAMLKHVAKKNGVVFHSDEYFVSMLEILGKKSLCGISYAYLDGKELAGALFVINPESKTMYYLHAGSFDEAREHNAGNLLLSHLIFMALNQGLDYFDMFGVSPPDSDSTHKWYGLSRFKRSFGGEDVTYNGTWEKGMHKLKYEVLSRIRQ